MEMSEAVLVAITLMENRYRDLVVSNNEFDKQSAERIFIAIGKLKSIKYTN